MSSKITNIVDRVFSGEKDEREWIMDSKRYTQDLQYLALLQIYLQIYEVILKPELFIDELSGKGKKIRKHVKSAPSETSPEIKEKTLQLALIIDTLEELMRKLEADAPLPELTAILYEGYSDMAEEELETAKFALGSFEYGHLKRLDLSEYENIIKLRMSDEFEDLMLEQEDNPYFHPIDWLDDISQLRWDENEGELPKKFTDELLRPYLKTLLQDIPQEVEVELEQELRKYTYDYMEKNIDI